MSMVFELADVLGRYVERAGYTPGQLARLTGLPKATIVNWLEGRVKRPRGVEDLLKLAALLHLTESEGSELLQSAGQPIMAEMIDLAQKDGNRALLALLAPWIKPVTPRPGHWLPPFQAIADLPHFVGREKLLADLKSALLTDQERSITSLHGMGGAGKTALAAHLAYQLRPHFPDGVLWAQVSRAEAMSILNTFAQAYGYDVSQYSDLNSRSRVVRGLLADKRVLLILDDVQNSEQIEPLLPPSGRCAVMITTRRHDLAVTRGANRFMIGSFDRSDEESLDLFRKILGDARVATGRDTLIAIADLLGHLPLAVDIVAGRLAYEPGWSAANFLARLQQEKRRLVELAYENQSIGSSFNLSYQTLEEALQRFFAILGLFVGDDFSSEAAAYVADLPIPDAEDFLRQLFNLSLVRQSRPGRFHLHLLLADFAREKAKADNQQYEGWRKRVITYFVTYVANHSRDYGLLELESNNIGLALQMAASQEEFDRELLTGLMAYLPFLEARGLYELAETLLLAGQKAGARLADAPGRVEILRYLGRMAERRGHYRPAESYYEQGLELARQQNNAQSLSNLLRALGALLARWGDNGLAEAYYREGLGLAREFASGEAASNLLRGLGVQVFIHGDLLRAEALYEGGLALAQASDEREKMSGLYWGLGMLAEEQRDLPEAEKYLRQALTLARELGYQERTILLLEDLSLIASEQGKVSEAMSCLEDGLLLARQLDHDWHRNWLANQLGNSYLEQGNWAAAGHLFREMLVNGRRNHNQEMTGRALFGLALTIQAEGSDPAGAVRLASESYYILQTIAHDLVMEVKRWLDDKRLG